ncbi:MAG: carbohydrate kinase [Candidatus Latescibacteria bacterium]|nr:carbohydrate kinase [Candidatus Latescibacterota bacterium]
MYILGYDIGSSSIKATLLDDETGTVKASATSPATELEIIAKKPGWAEQHPQIWWDNAKAATATILSLSGVDKRDIKAIGISYQMHGLVIVDKKHKVLRPSIIWCDSRAVEIGEKAFNDIGQETCLRRFLNSPGNFTASKLKWVKENEPDIYAQVYKAMLPGDYIAMKMSGEIKTTPSGLSEGILWDYETQDLAETVLEHYGISADKIADVVPTFSVQGELTRNAAEEMGLDPGTKISYRAGDQPNNALSLNVLNPGEIAATAGTSGVVYSVTNKAVYDSLSRVNPFVHVNYTPETPRYGVLLCINGTGILNSWLKHNVMNKSTTYETMNELAAQAPAGSDGLCILPFGNGAERTLANVDLGASFDGLQFNTHRRQHYLRAAQEGIVFALNYGLDITRDMGIEVTKVMAGNANMFLSPLFREVFATVTKTSVELYDTDGSQGAARGAGIGAGIYKRHIDAFVGLKTTEVIDPKEDLLKIYSEIYQKWLSILKSQLHRR